MIDLRLAPAATATWAATWWATGHPAQWSAICAFALAALACAASYARSHRGRRAPLHALTPPRSVRLGLALLLACIACALAVGSSARRHYDADPAHRDSGPIHARVVLQSDPAPASSGFSATRSSRARIDAVSVGEEWLPSNATALVRAPGWQDAARGDVYEVWGSLDATFAADAPSVGTIRVRRAQLIERPGGLSAWMRATHRAFARACSALPRDARSLVPGMAIGDDRGMPADLAQAMKTTSLTHLTAVSGAHIVIILATVTLVVPARKPLRLGATLLVLGTIVTLVGPEASVVRSVCVAAVAALGLILGRDGQSIAALGAVVIATLLIDPWASRSYGFALSALAALAVVGPSAALVRRCRRRIRGDTRVGKALRRLVEMVCVPALAELATAPLIVALSGNVPVWGIVANVIAEPAVPVATVAGLAGALISPLSIRGASACAVLASWATAWIAGAARMCASLPGNGVHVPGGSSTVLGMYACCGGGWVAWRAWGRWGAPLSDECDP
ncbi:MAG: ComEC/Rec2 family competence protein [Actinomyces sp.]|nr:ComEC/Rec2 family competence protein [Actinomyces sp.]